MPQLRALAELGEPLVVSGSGCCTYVGADRRGGAGAQIVSGEP